MQKSWQQNTTAATRSRTVDLGPQTAELGQPSYDGLLYRDHPRLYLIREKQEN
jgi:hypothetical protein